LLTRTKVTGLTGPVIIILLGLLPLFFLTVGDNSQLVVDSNKMGPYSWPRVMLISLATVGLFWGLSRLRNSSPNKISGEDSDQINTVKLVLGILSIVIYGIAIDVIGFAMGTFLFLTFWFILGGIRQPLVIISNSALGTGALLYLFLKVAYLPLPRGVEIFDTVTVNLYRLLGIY
jgi:putative tricarboxylic transport membrane protein